MSKSYSADEALTLDEAARMLQIETTTVRDWLERGLAHRTASDGTIYIRRSELDAFFAQSGQGQARDAATEA